MKNLYTTFFAGTALLLAGSLQAQQAVNGKGADLRARTTLINPAATGHHGTPAEYRGGPPANDNCASVATEALNAGTPLVLTGTTVGATNTGDAVAGSNLDLGGDTVFVFHKFVTTQCMDIAVAYCGTTPLPDIYQAVLSLTCPMDADFINFSGGEFTSCSDGNATIYWTALPAGTYYLPVRGEPATAGPYNIEITGTACPVAPSNDDCANAISITSNALCVTTSFTSAGATQTLAPVNCVGSQSPTANDVFFSFVATSTDQTIGVVGLLGTDAVVELFSGTCAALVSENCADSNANYPGPTDNFTEQIIETGLTVGTTYYVRVYDFNDHGALHNFEICVTEGSGNNIGMEEHSHTADWSIFPNPGAGTFTLQFSEVAGAGNVEVFDVTGRSVYTERTSLGATHTMDLSGVAPGNYTVRVTLNGERTEQRLIVQ